jgi:hypothetical protein
MAPNFTEATRKKVLLAAFGRALKDPFFHARTAGLRALQACQVREGCGVRTGNPWFCCLLIGASQYFITVFFIPLSTKTYATECEISTSKSSRGC